jgi:hypothetical protein
MPLLANNGWYVLLTKVGGSPSLNVSAYITDFSPDRSQNLNESTAGNASDVTRTLGLRDMKVSITMQYTTEIMDTLYTIIYSDTGFEMDFGTEGNGAGKPRHTQVFFLEGAPFTIVVNKEPVALELSCAGAAAPSRNMYTGSKF